MAAWRAWLGTAGTPPPLDRFLARARPDRETFAAVVRTAAWAPAVLAALDPRPPPPGGVALCDRLRALDPADAVEAAAALAGSGGRPVLRKAVDALRSRLRGDRRWEARCLLHGVPVGFAPHLARWAARSGEDPVLGWLGAQGTRPPLWVRPRGPDAAAALRAEGFRVDEVDRALRVAGDRAITASSAYRTGRIEVQDLASQRCGALALPAPGQVAWDVCAGRGGKTTQLADALRGRGAVHATDIDPGKRAALRTRLRRAGLADVVRVHAWDGRRVPAFGPEARRGFDVVLVDAPCSSTGTWRRNPDARLRVEPDAIPRYAGLQVALLGLGAEALAPGGRLVYATCSWCVDEDEEVVERVAGERGLRVAAIHRLGPPALDSDTLFVAVLSRRG